jgi:hypothetical protein
MKINKKLWDKFINTQIVINCKTETEAIKLINYCISNDIGWAEGDIQNNNLWYINKELTCYECDIDKELCVASIDYYKNSEIKIIAFSGMSI